MFYKYSRKIDCEDASKVFSKIHQKYEQKFLLESLDISQVYGRLSLIGVQPALEIRGKDEEFSIMACNERGREFLKDLRDEDLKICDEVKRDEMEIKGKVRKKTGDFEEENRTRQKNIAQIIRVILGRFKQEEKGFFGLYGAFSYDFVRLFEDIPNKLPSNDIYDFRLGLYDTFVFFDHLKDEAEVVTYRKVEKFAKTDAEFVARQIERGQEANLKFIAKDSGFELGEEEYGEMVKGARKLAKEGELFEIVYSNTLKAGFAGDAFALYQRYREANPSPYLFYFDFCDEQLCGASPEMMVRCERGIVQLRPISGTARRGADPIEDHENMLELLKSEKERAELDMLIDLGRNDMARICEPGIKVSDYRFVEKYSKVMHTVAHLSGKLRKEFQALDALVACMNAGTLTGAPKVAAMIEIEKNEKSRRGYYGGAIGYLTFAGDMDTGIIIRTAHIKNGELSFRVGATLLYDSVPEAEYRETMNKAEAFLTTIK